MKYAAYTKSSFFNKTKYLQIEINKTAEINVIKIVLLLKAAAKYSQKRNFKIKEKKIMVNKMNKFSRSR